MTQTCSWRVITSAWGAVNGVVCASVTCMHCHCGGLYVASSRGLSWVGHIAGRGGGAAGVYGSGWDKLGMGGQQGVGKRSCKLCESGRVCVAVAGALRPLVHIRFYSRLIEIIYIRTCKDERN